MPKCSPSHPHSWAPNNSCSCWPLPVWKVKNNFCFLFASQDGAALNQWPRLAWISLGCEVCGELEIELRASCKHSTHRAALPSPPQPVLKVTLAARREQITAWQENAEGEQLEVTVTAWIGHRAGLGQNSAGQTLVCSASSEEPFPGC